MRFNPEVNYGALLQASVVAVGAIFAYAALSNQSSQTARDLAATRVEFKEALGNLEKSVSSSGARTEAKMDAGLNAIQTQIRDLPNMGAEVTQLQRRMLAQEQSQTAQDQRIAEQDRRITEIAADLRSVTRSSQVPLPAPGRAPR